VLSRVAQFKVVVVNDVEGATSDERARLAIDEGVVVYVPTGQLVVQVNSLQIGIILQTCYKKIDTIVISSNSSTNSKRLSVNGNIELGLE
jgi:hypothetical protein